MKFPKTKSEGILVELYHFIFCSFVLLYLNICVLLFLLLFSFNVGIHRHTGILETNRRHGLINKKT